MRYQITIDVDPPALITNCHHALGDLPGVEVVGVERATSPEHRDGNCPGCEPIPEVGMVCPERDQ